ncbi:unnamed protein product, partial [Thlaspi arvense]
TAVTFSITHNCSSQSFHQTMPRKSLKVGVVLVADNVHVLATVATRAVHVRRWIKSRRFVIRVAMEKRRKLSLGCVAYWRVNESQAHTVASPPFPPKKQSVSPECAGPNEEAQVSQARFSTSQGGEDKVPGVNATWQKPNFLMATSPTTPSLWQPLKRTASYIKSKIIICFVLDLFWYFGGTISSFNNYFVSAAGFALVVENVSPGTKFDHVPSCFPGTLITDVSKSMDLTDYYNYKVTTSRDWMGRVKSFKAEGSIGDGLEPILKWLCSLICSAWSENGTDEANYIREGFALISGTRMAAPYIAGIAALVKQKHPPAAIKSALMTTPVLE